MSNIDNDFEEIMNEFDDFSAYEFEMNDERNFVDRNQQFRHVDKFNETLLKGNVSEAFFQLGTNGVTVNSLNRNGYEPLYAVLYLFYDEFVTYNWFAPAFGVYTFGDPEYAPGPYPNEERIFEAIAFLLYNGANPDTQNVNTPLKLVYQIIY